jgi:HSP20 family protein
MGFRFIGGKMTALALLNRRLNDFDSAFGRNFFSPVWLDQSTEVSSTKYGFSSEMKYDEASTSWKLTLEAAGVTKENLKIDTKEGFLSVTGEKTKGLELGKFERHFKLPEGIDLEKIEATFEDGVLTVQMPLEAKKAPKTISIK